jgi:hypothetical protein
MKAFDEKRGDVSSAWLAVRFRVMVPPKLSVWRSSGLRRHLAGEGVGDGLRVRRQAAADILHQGPVRVPARAPQFTTARQVFTSHLQTSK